MTDITVRPWMLRGAGDACEANVAGQLDGAVTAFADAESTPSVAGMDFMRSFGAANACIAGWHETFRDARRTMYAVSDKLRATSAVVNDTDADAADLYRGVAPNLPPISIDIGE